MRFVDSPGQSLHSFGFETLLRLNLSCIQCSFCGPVSLLQARMLSGLAPLFFVSRPNSVIAFCVTSI